MVYVQVRRTLDWRDEAAVRAGLVEEFQSKLETWNATFNIPYHAFRQRVKEIAQLNLSRIANVRFVTDEPAPPDAILVPVDDDDWFAPHLADRLGEESDPSILAYHWTRHILEPERHRRRLKGLVKERLTGVVVYATNNYALRNRPGVEALLAHHVAASDHFRSRPDAVKYLPAALSMHNRNPASQTALKLGHSTITRAELLQVYAQYRALYARTFLFGRLRWARPYVALMAELMAELKPK
jgi:hypothetical protein